MPASQSPSDRPANRPTAVPMVPRPRAPIIDEIEHEGISWEGQVLVVGQDGDIPALLFVTAERFLLTNRDTILLEAPRSWLIPAPLRIRESDVRISITPEGVVPGRTTTERLLLTVREGRGPASQLVAILTGRARKEQLDAEFPTWKNGVGAGRSISLPPLPAFEATQDTTDRQRDTAAPDAWEERPARKKPLPFQAPEPEPVEPQSRAARFLSTRPVVAEPVEAPPAETAEPANVTSITEERRRRGAGPGIWVTRIAMVAIITLVGSWFARPYLPDEINDRLPAALQHDDNDTEPELAADPGGVPQESNSETGDGTTGAGTSPEEIMPTEAALGVGGATSEIPDAGGNGDDTGPSVAIPTPTPPSEGSDDSGNADAGQESLTTEPEVVDPPADTDDVADDGAGDEPVGEVPVDDEPVSTEPPIVVQTPEAPDIETPNVPDEPDIETPDTPDEPDIETPAPTEAPAEETPVPTEAPATETAAPTEDVPTSTPETEETEPPVETEVPEQPTLEPQEPSVNPDEPPAQEFVAEGFRYSVEGATTGTSLPELPDVAEVTYGEWIVLVLSGQNWTGQEQVFDMSQFALIADGEEIQLDVGNSWVASLLGYTPAYGNTDAILWAPGEEHEFVLTFLAPLEAESLSLRAGNQVLDLGSILETTPSLAEMRQGAAPDTIDATVVDVLDAETIVIEKDGVQQTVRYLGIDVPSGDDCYAAEATEIHRSLVAGRNVKIERQATDVDARGNWVRDVWVEQDDGRYVLVAHQLVEQGAATAGISEPNTRFASWLRGAEAVAQAEARGLWGACGETGTQSSDTPLAVTADGRRFSA